MDKIGFALAGVKTEQFAEFSDKFNENEAVQFEHRHTYGANSENKMVAIFSEFRFLQSETIFLMLELSSHFKILEKNWELFIDKESNSIKLPKGFISHLLLLNISTSRGVLHAKTEGNKLNKFTIPILDVSQIIKSAVDIDL